MYPASLGNQWLSNNKPESAEEKQDPGNAARSWQWRERGLDPPNYTSNKRVLENLAEDILVRKPLEVRSCDLPGYPRSTFLMVFSPDGTKVASTHGNHNVYVSELASGKHVRILKGHPRTPWCIAFHPSHPQLIGSGCLGGQVRVWDIGSGGSEVWNVRNETVIASIAFHPREQLLVIATYNELYFWDWSQPAPFTKVSTNNVNEKVRYVAFDSLGYKLITGISLWACTVNSNNNPLLSQNLSNTSSSSSSSSGSNGGNGGSGNNGANGNTGNGANRGDNDDNGRPPESPGAAQDMIVNSYQTLVQRYDSLVRNYQRLFMVRHRLTNTPPTPNTIDRGTDPMETYPIDHGRRRRSLRRAARATHIDTHDSLNSPSTSRQARQDGGDSGEGESSSRLLNLDVLSFDSDASRNQDSPSRERSTFGSSSSAFQPLNESGRSFRSVEQGERSTRLLPNPFSSTSTSSSPRPTRFSEPASTDAQPNPNSSRTSIFTSSLRRRNYPASEGAAPTVASASTSAAEPQPSTSRSATQTPTTTNSSTQMSPDGDAQSINESLDLIRDILRDSGTRLLNLITNMSMNILSNSERGEEGERRRARPRMRLFSGDLRRDFLASSSDSDSDHTEVNILRTPNSTFRESEASGPERAAPPAPGATPPDAPTDRMVFELGEEAPDDDADVVVSLSSRRFRVRTQSASAVEDAPQAAREPVAGPSSRADPDPALDPAAPSTSRDDLWLRGPNISAEEAYRRVRFGVSTLQKHTFELANMWLRGDRTTMRHLRTMWENLRRRIFALRRDTVRQDSPGYYTRSLLERCMILTEMTDIAARHGAGGRTSRNGVRGDLSDRTPEGSPPTDRAGPSTAPPDGRETETRDPSAGSSRPAPPENGTEVNHRTTGTRPIRAVRASTSRSSPFLRRRLHPSDRAMALRWRAEDDLRRRSRHAAAAPRLAMRFGRPRDRDFARAVNMTATRHEIRMRAMQVLSVMFNMMMMCLEERGLSQLIINMLKTLKKALALTCFMLVSNRNVPRPGANPTPAAAGVDSMDVVRIQNVDHTGPVNVDGPDDPASPHVAGATSAGADEDGDPPAAASSPLPGRPATSRATSTEQPSPADELPSPLPSPSSSVGSRWSHRLAVQIAAANRNTSATARTRREMYQETKRQKALHRTNPTVHPLIKKRIPPVSSHRIPALRSLPSRSGPSVVRTPRVQQPPEEPVAGPSNAAPSNATGSNAAPSNATPPSNDTNDSPPRNRDVSEFDNRENFIRIAHMQAVRLRNAARNRIRRLQTIRFYTPSSVQEIFAFQPSGEPSASSGGEQAGSSGGGGERAGGSGSGGGGERAAPERAEGAATEPEAGPSAPDRPSSRFAEAMRRSINVTFSPNIFPGNQETHRQHEAELRAIMNNVALPLMQVNDMAPAAEPQAQRLPRIHEYLQPIILAQNAMVVEEDGDGGGGGGGGGGARRLGGMAGLLDAGIISEALPAPSHRVQAWDFTTGAAPHIADNTKNVVVQRCRIHNDASIDISKDGRLLVALLPVPRLRNTNKCLGVYSLEWANLGQCLHTAALEQSAVSVALSPSARYLAVGLGSRRFTSAPHARNNIIALLYKLEDTIETTNRTGLTPIKELEQNWEHGFTSLNCLRWAPQPGQGLVYANNTGQLIIMS